MCDVVEKPLASSPASSMSTGLRPERRHRSIRILILLSILALAVVLGGDFQRGTFVRQEIRIVHAGPFVQAPLNAIQLNNLWHLVTRMQYKQLASLYVSHMTLDEELGQLFMVQSYD